MKIDIINIGDELLIGQVVNTNASWMAEQLTLAGFRVDRVTVVADAREAILAILTETGSRCDAVLVTGGLGPTKDDITKHTLCEFFDTRLVFSEEALRNIERLFPSRGLPITETNRQQAMVPESCIPFQNPNGTAPGMWMEGTGKKGDPRGADFVFLPGVPFELHAMMTETVIPRLRERFKPGVILHRTVLAQGIGESFLSDLLEPWETKLPPGISLAYLPQPGIVRLRLTGTGTSGEAVRSAIDREAAAMESLISQYVFGYENDTLEELVGKILLERNATLATAESCTGGTLAQMITGIPGSSRYFRGSVVAYSNDLKQELLGVLPETLTLHGAVSEQVAMEMAAGAQKRLRADFAIAVTGIAGPDGGTPDKPVGTTWIAIATPGEVTARKYLFGEHRGRNIRRAALTGLNMLRKALNQEKLP